MHRSALFGVFFTLVTVAVSCVSAGCSGDEDASAAGDAPADTPSDVAPGPVAAPASEAAPAAPDPGVAANDAPAGADPTTVAKPFSVLPWWAAAGIPVRVVLVPNEGAVIGIHSATNDLVVTTQVEQAAENNASWTLGIREVEPLEYNTSADYRAMVARLVHEAENVASSPRRILLLFNTGTKGSHDPMTTLPGAGAAKAAADLRALLAAHPHVRLSMEVYCSGAMTVSQWHQRLVALKSWAADIGVAPSRVTVNEDISNTTAASGESYGTLGHPDLFNQRLLTQADDAKKMGFGGVDYICAPPSGTYPTLASTYDTIRAIYKATNVDAPPPN